MREIVCIVCPNGCTLSVDEQTLAVTGNKCRKGADFAVAELTCPTRTICSTVKTAFPETPVLPVRVSKEIPKDKIFDVMAEIDKVVVNKRIARGETVIGNVLGLGADVIATSSVLVKNS